jgi:probable phosphoglycerate mutase
MKLILTRHGETIENKKGIVQGWLPGHLSPLGKKQARRLALRLKDITINLIYTSDLARAYDTAKIISKFHPKTKLIKDRRLREKHLGKKIEGKPISLSKVPFMKAVETKTHFYNRLKFFYKFILKKHHSKTILVVGHGGSIYFLNGVIHKWGINESLKKALHENAAISEYEIDKKGKVKVIHLNSLEHLK